MTGRGGEAFISLDPDGDVTLVGRAIDDQQLNPEHVPKSTSWSISTVVDNTVSCGSPAVIQNSAEVARLGSGFQTDSDRMILWSG